MPPFGDALRTDQIKGIVTTPQALTLTTNTAVDLRFTGPAAGDPPGFKAWYGFVGVEANKSGDAVLAYQRTGSFVAPEARYSAYYLTESDIRASQLLMAGNSSLGQCPQDLTKNQNCTHHYMGMSVDPWDETGVWVIDGFALNGGWGFVVGKALAPGYPDLTYDAASVLQASRPGAYHLRLTLHNQGDGQPGRTSCAYIWRASEQVQERTGLCGASASTTLRAAI